MAFSARSASKAELNLLLCWSSAAKSGRLPADAMVYGWHGGGGRPPDAVDTDNDEVMLAWANTRLVIGLRVDPRNDGMLRIDSDMMRQMGLPELRGGGEPAS